MRVYLCGQKHFGAAVLAALQPVCTLVGVSSPPFASAATTTGEPLPDRLHRAAAVAGLPWLPAGELRAPLIRSLNVDLIVAAHSHDYLGRLTRAAARLGAIGYHPSLLPLHRGRDAVRWTVHQGDRITGGSVYWLDQNVDGGPLVAQQHVCVPPGMGVENLWKERLSPLGVRLLVQVVSDLAAGRAVACTPQEECCATWEPSWSRPPVFRPELPQLGTAPFTICAPGE